MLLYIGPISGKLLTSLSSVTSVARLNGNCKWLKSSKDNGHNKVQISRIGCAIVQYLH